MTSRPSPSRVVRPRPLPRASACPCPRPRRGPSPATTLPPPPSASPPSALALPAVTSAFRWPDRVRPDDGLRDASDEPPDGGRGTWVSLDYSNSASSPGEASSRDHAGMDTATLLTPWQAERQWQQHAFAREAGEAGWGSGIGADPTDGHAIGAGRTATVAGRTLRTPRCHLTWSCPTSCPTSCTAMTTALTTVMIATTAQPRLPRRIVRCRAGPRAVRDGRFRHLPLVPGWRPHVLAVADHPPLCGGRSRAR